MSLNALNSARAFVEWLQAAVGELKPEVVATLEENEVDGPAALECTDDDWKDMVKAIGLRRKIINAIQKERSPDASEGGGSASSAAGVSSYGGSSSSSATPSSSTASRYAFKRLLGTGAFGAVELVHDTAGNIDVAKKVGKAGTLEEANKDLEEAQTMIQIKHPNTVQFMACFMDQDHYKRFQVNIIMEYCAGGDLQVRIDAVEAAAPFLEDDVAHVLSSCLNALDYIHQQNMIHRDIKPANIMLSTPGAIKDAAVKIADFGLTKNFEMKSLASQRMSMKSVHGKAGTEVFMAPEVFHDQKYTSNVDVWSLGITLVYMMSLKRPIAVVDDARKVARLLKTIDMHSSALLKEACAFMLEVDASRRPTAKGCLLRGGSGFALPTVDAAAELLCPHRQPDPVRAASDERTDGCLHQLLQKLKDDTGTTDLRTKTMIKNCLRKAANKAIAMIATLSVSEVASVAALFLESMQASVATLAAGKSSSKELPLHKRLEAVLQVLLHFAYTVLSFCDRPMLADEPAILQKLTAMVIEPAIQCMRDGIRSMQEDVRSDTDYYHAQLAELSKHDKAIYNAEFSKRTTGSASSKQDFESMCGAIAALSDQVSSSNPPPRRQPTGDMLRLMCLCMDGMPHFQAIITRMLDRVANIKLVFRAETKALYRLAEKSELKGPASKSNGGDGVLLDGVPLDCSAVCDVVGCLVICQDFKCMKDVVDCFKEHVQRPQEDGAAVCQVKSRWTVGSDGGWRDVMCMLAISNVSSSTSTTPSITTTIICEVQIVLDTMFNARKGLKGHEAYATFRSFFEMLNFEGSKGGGGKRQQAANTDAGAQKVAAEKEAAAAAAAAAAAERLRCVQAEADAKAAASVEEGRLAQLERDQKAAAQLQAQQAAVEEEKRVVAAAVEGEAAQLLAKLELATSQRGADKQHTIRRVEMEAAALLQLLPSLAQLEAEQQKLQFAFRPMADGEYTSSEGGTPAAAKAEQQPQRQHAEAVAKAAALAASLSATKHVFGSVGQRLVKSGMFGMSGKGTLANNYELSENKAIATKLKTGVFGSHRGVVADGDGCGPMVKGRHFWQLGIVAHDAGYTAWYFGVCRPGINLNDAASEKFHNRDDTWMMFQNNDPKWELHCSTCKGSFVDHSTTRRLQAGDRMGLLLDLDNGGTLTMYLHGKPCGTIAEGLAGPLYPCIASVYEGKVVKIHSGPEAAATFETEVKWAATRTKLAFGLMVPGEYRFSEGGTVATKVGREWSGSIGAICDGKFTGGGPSHHWARSRKGSSLRITHAMSSSLMSPKASSLPRPRLAGHTAAAAAAPMAQGKHHVQLGIVGCSGYGSDWYFGVCRPGIDLNDGRWFHNRDDTWLMHQTNLPQWSLACNSNRGNFVDNSIDRNLKAGDRVGLLLDLDNGGTLTLYLDGKPCGTIAEGLVGPLHWCIASGKAGIAVRIQSLPVPQ